VAATLVLLRPGSNSCIRIPGRTGQLAGFWIIDIPPQAPPGNPAETTGDDQSQELIEPATTDEGTPLEAETVYFDATGSDWRKQAHLLRRLG